MAWQPVAFSPSAALGAVTGGAQAATSGAPAALSAASARLGAATPPAYVKSPVAASAGAAATMATTLAGLLQHAHRYLFAHPWQQGIGTGDGLYRSLSAPNALQALASKLRDTADPHVPTGSIEAVGLLVASNNYAGLATHLSSFNSVLPLPETLMAQRRAQALADWERQKVTLPHTAQNTRWSTRQHGQNATLRTAQACAGDLVADVAGYDAENITPVAELQALATKKQTVLATHTAALAALNSTLSGSTGFALAAGNTIPDIVAALTSGGPGHEYTLSVACLIVATPGNLTLLKEIVGL